MRQHRLSEFYLRGFTRPKGKRVIFRYERGSSAVIEVTASTASAEDDAFEGPELNYRAVESFFAAIESHVKPVFDAIRQQRDIGPNARSALSTYAVLCHLRSAKRNAEAVAFNKSIRVNDLAKYLHSSSARVAAMLRYPKLTADVYDKGVEVYLGKLTRGIQQVPQVKYNHHFVLLEEACRKWKDALLAAEWRIEIAPPGETFILGDEAIVSRRRGHPYDPYYVGISRFDLDAETILPLNRRTCLVAVGGDSENPLRYAVITTERVRELNLRSVVCAHRYIYSSVNSQAVKDLIDEVGERRVTMAIPNSVDELLHS